MRITVTHKGTTSPQRLLIAGSSGSDGNHPGTPGRTIDVNGNIWTLDLEFRGVDAEWYFSFVHPEVAYTVDSNLVFTLGALNGHPIFPFEWDDLIVTVAPRNQALNPMHPHAPPPNVSIPDCRPRKTHPARRPPIAAWRRPRTLERLPPSFGPASSPGGASDHLDRTRIHGDDHQQRHPLSLGARQPDRHTSTQRRMALP